MPGDRCEPRLMLVPLILFSMAGVGNDAPAGSSNSAASLFQQVCMEGKVRLDRTALKTITLSDLPWQLRGRVRHSVSASYEVSTASGPAYVLVGAAMPGSAYAQSCVVFAQARFLDVVAVTQPGGVIPEDRPISSRLLAFSHLSSEGYQITITRLHNKWLAMATEFPGQGTPDEFRVRRLRSLSAAKQKQLDGAAETKPEGKPE